jgi:hypothetical protein
MSLSYERRLSALEASYRELLLSALQKCAKGRWGLFAHNERAARQMGARARSRLRDLSVEEILELGSEIERLRRKRGLDSFPLHDRLLRMRSAHDSHTLGEPKLAQQWLDEFSLIKDMSEVKARCAI